MPDGKTHNIVTEITSGTLFILCPILVFKGAPGSILAIPFGCLAGLFITPDLDIRLHPTQAHSNARRFFPRFLAFAHYWFWRPYSLLIPAHRHWLSHGLVIGTTIRVIYFLLLTAGCFTLIRYFYDSPIFWFFLVGLLLVDCLHTISDTSRTRFLQLRSRFFSSRN